MKQFFLTIAAGGGLLLGAHAQPGTVPSAVQARYPGKVVFASTLAAVERDHENPAAFGSSFTLGQPIFFRAYLNGKLGTAIEKLLPDVSPEVLETHARFGANFYLDGKLAHAHIMNQLSADPPDYQLVSFKGALQSGDDQAYAMMLEFQEFLTAAEAGLTPGSHQLRLEIVPAIDYPEEKRGPVLASGELTLKVGSSVVNPNDALMCLPAAGLKDATLEASMLQAFKAKGWPEKPTRARITGSGWNIVRHPVTGVILKRSIRGLVASTTATGCQYQDFVFSQAHTGAGYQAAVYIDGIGGPTNLPCGCLK